MSQACDLVGVIDVLERTPAALHSMLSGLPDEAVRATEGEDSWSPFDVVGHLIHGERTDWIPRLRVIIESGELHTFDPFDRLAQLEANTGESLDDLLAEFSALRRSNLESLAGLLAGGLDLLATGMHPELGRVTAGELLSTWATHDLGHLAQISRVLAKRLGPATGPWRAYLPILTDRA